MITDVIPTLKDLTPQKIYGKTVIVLDIFRCTSTIVTALANGCTEVIPALNADDAKGIVEKLPVGSFVVAGEVNGTKIPEFQLGNSPVDFSRDPVRLRTVVLTTTNGTKAIRNCKPAKHVLIGSFLNVNSVCSLALSHQKDIIIVCAGTEGNIALEDIMAAGCYIMSLKTINHELRFSDLSRTFYFLYKYFQDNLEQILLTSRSGLNLQRLGYQEDISYCLQKNKFKIVPVFRNNSVQLSQPMLLHNEL